MLRNLFQLKINRLLKFLCCWRFRLSSITRSITSALESSRSICQKIVMSPMLFILCI